MTAVSAKDISLRYDKKDVVKSFSADFTQGKIISIIGPNGSGKSTILRSFARLLNTACGQIPISQQYQKRNLQNDWQFYCSTISRLKILQ